MNRTNFSTDLDQSRIITSYIENKLYNNKIITKLNSQEKNVISYEINTTNSNDNGKDVTLRFSNNEIWVIDEKAALHYDQSINPLDSFTLEIFSKVQNNQRKIGWFLRTDLETTHYLFIWASSIDSTQTYTRYKKEYTNFTNNIQNLEIKLVNKKRLLNHLQESYNLSPERLLQDSNTLLNENKSRINYTDGLALIHSPQYPESPVNLKVPKSIYSEITLLDLTI